MIFPNPDRSKLSAKTYAFIRMMLKAKVFVKIDPKLLSDDTPEVLIACFDPNRFPDKWDHYRTLGGNCRCCVPLPFPGGSLVIPEHSPLAVTKGGDRKDNVLLDMLDMAVEELGAKKIRPLVHYPCLAVEKSGLTDLQVVKLNIDAKDRLRPRYKGVDIALLVHVDWHGYPEANKGTGMNTYKFDRRTFNVWEESEMGRHYQDIAA